MPVYRYKARGCGGDALEGVVDAANVDLAANQLIDRDITPIEIHPLQAKHGLGSGLKDLFSPRVEPVDLMQFSRQMHSLLRAGVPILNALSGLATNTRNLSLSSAISQIISDLQAGKDLSTAFAQHPAVFSDFYVSLIRVGESSGQLEEIFQQLAHYIHHEKNTRDRVKSAMRYPLFVLGAILTAFVIINLFVIPAFSAIFERLGGQLPVPTKILILMSDMTIHHWKEMLIVTIVSAIWVSLYISRGSGRYFWHKTKLGLPLLGPVIYQATLARFTRLYSLAQRSGLPVINALSVVAQALDNEYMEERVLSMREGIQRGESLSYTASGAGIFDHLVLQMIQVGEESGTIDKLLKDVSDYYDDQIEYAVEKLSASVEPVLTIALAALVALLASGIFLPMWDLYKVALH